MPNMSKQYQLILGTFIDNEFIWHDVDSYDTLEEAYKEFKKYVNTQLKYTDEELIKVWNSGRLDVELRRGNRLLNWVGIYAREVDKLAEEEEDEANKENPEKKSTKDAIYNAGANNMGELRGEIFVRNSDKTITKKNTIVVPYTGDLDKNVGEFLAKAKQAANTFNKEANYKCVVLMHAVDDEGEPFVSGDHEYFYYDPKSGFWLPTTKDALSTNKVGPKDSLDIYPIYKADLQITLPDILGEETTAKLSISFKDDGSVSDPEKYIFSKAGKQIEKYFKLDINTEIFGTFTCDGQEIDAGKYQAVQKLGEIVWVPIDIDPSKPFWLKDSFQFSKEQYESAKDELTEKIFADPKMLTKYVTAIEYYRDIDIPKPALTSKEEFKKYLDRYFDLWDIYNTLEFLDDEGREFLKTDIKDDKSGVWTGKTAKTAQGYDVIDIYHFNNRDYALIKRKKDFVVGAGYQADGTWDQGYYDFTTEEKARKFAERHAKEIG